jgi:hypothetical protein
MSKKLSFRLPVLEEEITKPDLGKMGLVLVGCIYLFYCVEGLCLEVEALPYFGKTSAA